MKCAYCKNDVDSKAYYFDSRLDMAMCCYEHIVLATFETGEVIFAQLIEEKENAD